MKFSNFANSFIMKKAILLGISGIFTTLAMSQVTRSQILGQNNAITTMVPFLTITPDSRAASMGDAGVAMINPDANGLYFNVANLVNTNKKTGISVSYAPWLRKLVNDVGYQNIVGYAKLNDRSVVGGGLRWFSLGNINFTDIEGNPQGNDNPQEISIEGAYGLRVNKRFSLGVNMKFIYSNIAANRAINGTTYKAGTSAAADVSFAYKMKPIKLKSKGTKIDWNLGGAISNMGAKMTYSNREARDFIPANLKLGTSFGYKIDDYNRINFLYDINKLLVPTKPIRDASGKILEGKDPNVGVAQGMIQSFYDAPAGFREELREINHSVGAEYWYTNSFAFRLGGFFEHKTKGARQYLTFGFGIRYSSFTIDAGMLVPVISQHPLANQLRFSLLFDFGALTDKTDD